MNMPTEKFEVEILRQNHKYDIISLVPLDTSHSQQIVDWRNDPLNGKWFFSKTKFSVAAHEDWLFKTQESDTDFNWMIMDANNCAVGTVGLYNIDWTTSSAEFGRLLIGRQSNKMKGLGYQATLAVLDLAKRIKLRSIYLEVMSENSAAIKLYRRAGFELSKISSIYSTMEIQLKEKKITYRESRTPR